LRVIGGKEIERRLGRCLSPTFLERGPRYVSVRVKSLTQEVVARQSVDGTAPASVLRDEDIAKAKRSGVRIVAPSWRERGQVQGLVALASHSGVLSEVKGSPRSNQLLQKLALVLLDLRLMSRTQLLGHHALPVQLLDVCPAGSCSIEFLRQIRQAKRLPAGEERRMI
jgi:hypothetical protein